jgi:hypothetical protein
MKQYVIDELRPGDYENVKAYMEENFKASSVPDLYWIPLDESLLGEVQLSHKDCHPFYFSVEISPQQIACELLVRTNQRMRCSCIDYATRNQRNWLIEKMDSVMEELGIKT